MPHTIDDLRNHLFETIAALRDKDKPLDIDRAKAIAEVGKVIVESAKVEVAFAAATGQPRTSAFLPAAEVERKQAASAGPKAISKTAGW